MAKAAGAAMKAKQGPLGKRQYKGKDKAGKQQRYAE